VYVLVLICCFLLQAYYLVILIVYVGNINYLHYILAKADGYVVRNRTNVDKIMFTICTTYGYSLMPLLGNK